MKDILIVYKKSLYDLYKVSPDEAVQKYLRKDDVRVSRMIQGHDTHNRSMYALQNILDEVGASYDFTYRADLKDFPDINEKKLVIAAGGDGTLLEVARHLDNGKVLGYITDTLYSVGFFSWANKDSIRQILENIDSVPVTVQKRFDVTKNGEILSTMLNDVCFDDKNSAARSMWEIQDHGLVGGSGVLVSSAIGSTAWIYQEGGDIMPVTDERLQYKVRANKILSNGYAEEVELISHNREGMISIDGEHNRFPCTLGDVLDVLPSETPVRIVGDLCVLRQKWEERFLNKN